MSVTEISDIASPQLTDTSTGVSVVRKLKAVCDSLNDDATVVRANGSCPRRGDTYSFRGNTDSTLICTTVSIDPKADSEGLERGLAFDVTATYSNSVDTGSLGDDEENPLDDPPVYEFTFNKYQIPAEYDVDGEAVVNGADEAFDPPFLIDENRPIITITRNESSFSGAVAVEYQDTVNDDSFAGCDPGVAKMIGISARQATRGSYSYWVVTYEIEFRWNGWNPTRLLAQGYRYRLSADGNSQNYIDPVTGSPPTTPLLLQLNGMESPPVDGVRPTFFHEFNFYREKTFGLLNLGL